MNLSRKVFSFKVACLSVILLALAPLALAQNGARLYFQPVTSAGEMVTVELMAENVTDLYGLELRLRYDPAVLEIQDSQADQPEAQIEAGSFLPVDQGFIVVNRANQAEGTIFYAATLLSPAPAVSGSGPLARLTFKRLHDTPSTLAVEQATLVSVHLQTIPVETTPLTVIGSGNNFPWWMVGAALLGLGILAVGAFVVLSSFNKKSQSRSARGATSGSGRRPSAFNDPVVPDSSQPRR